MICVGQPEPINVGVCLALVLVSEGVERRDIHTRHLDHHFHPRCSVSAILQIVMKLSIPENLRGFYTNCVFICSDGLGWIVFSHLNFDDRKTSGQSAGIAFPRLNLRPPSAPVRSLGGDDDNQKRKF